MLTMTAALTRAGLLYGEQPAILDAEGSFTWAEHLERVAKVAGFFQSWGLEKGQRLGILSPNVFRQCELFHGGYWSGIVPVPINCRLAPPEIAFILENADCKALAVHPMFLELLDAPELAPWKDVAFALGDAPGIATYDSLLAQSEPLSVRDAREDEDAILIYTGGTTGRSKGVRLTHGNVISNGLQVGMVFKPLEDEVYLHVAPMFHSADLLSTGVTLRGGAHCYLPAFTPEAFLTAIQTHKVTSTMVAPTMLIMLLQSADPSAYDLSSLKRILYGSAPMAEQWIRKALEAFPGVELFQGYGLTETSPILTLLDHDDHLRGLDRKPELLKSVGRPLTGVDLKIDEEGGGEVLVRGPNVTRGYLNLEEVNEQTYVDGWFRTGDVGRVDEGGYVYLLDRKKDMIVSGGENIYSSEVEAALYKVPGVVEAAVYGTPHALYGEAVTAALVMAPDSAVSEEQVINHCRNYIGGFKVPKRVHLLETLPKSAVGKVLKTELRATYSQAEED